MLHRQCVTRRAHQHQWMGSCGGSIWNLRSGYGALNRNLVRAGCGQVADVLGRAARGALPSQPTSEV